MSQDDVTQIRVGGSNVGILGLKAALEEVAGKHGEKTDQRVTQELFDRLEKRNYIPEKAKKEYEKAFLREFKKLVGMPFEDDFSGGLEIKVLGPGCMQCDRLEKELIQIMAETGIAADLEHIRDVKEIGKYGVMGTPALIINGRVKSVGKVPPRNKIKQWLSEAEKETHDGD